MFPLKPNEIKKLNNDDLEELARLDGKGLLVAPGETLEDYKKRLLKMAENYARLERDLNKEGEVCLFDFVNVQRKMRIPEDLIEEATDIDSKTYQFSVDWVPGFFMTRKIGLLWAGCALSCPETLMSIFLIRKSFAHSEKFLWIYSRKELLSHETCHVVRMPIMDSVFEEYFAYQLSASRLRRWFGCSFQTALDAILFIVPVFILLSARFVQHFKYPDLWMWPFFTLVAVYPAFMLLRTLSIHKTINAAARNLKQTGISDPRPVLYRCNCKEILFFARNTGVAIRSWLKERVAKQLRWQVIDYRFIKE